MAHAASTTAPRALCVIDPVVAEVRSLAREFLSLIHRRRLRQFDAWLKRLSRCSAPEMRGFAVSLRSDLPAVRAASLCPGAMARPRAT